MPFVFHWLLINLYLQVFHFCSIGGQKITSFAFLPVFILPGASRQFSFGICGGYLSPDTSGTSHPLFSVLRPVLLCKRLHLQHEVCLSWWPGLLRILYDSSVSYVLPGVCVVKNLSPTPSTYGHLVSMLFLPGLLGTFPVIIAVSQITPNSVSSNNNIYFA